MNLIIHNDLEFDRESLIVSYKIVRSYDDYLLCEWILGDKQYLFPIEKCKIPTDHQVDYIQKWLAARIAKDMLK